MSSLTAANDVIEAGIDYFAMTLSRGAANSAQWEGACRDAIYLLSQHGNTIREGTFRGFDGYWCGGAFAGTREEDAYIHIPGAWAARLWGQLFRDDAHYSRLDLQATVRFGKEDNDYGRSAYAIAVAHNLCRPRAQQRKISTWSDSDGGYTLYIGARSSNHFCRLYNKAAASEDEAYERCWRFEVELHNESATKAAQYIYNGAKSQPRAAASTVWQYYRERGIEPPYTRESEDNAVLPVATPTTDLERKLRWLNGQVAPTVRLLLEHCPRDIVLTALGIGPGAEPLPVEGRPEGKEETDGTANGRK